MSTVSHSSKNSQQRRPAAADTTTNFETASALGSEVSATTSVGWSGDYCKKMMALNWDYTCGPLRVVQVGPHNHHWARLHAPGYSVLPSADGTLQHFREAHKHTTDAELLKQVLRSGVAKIKRDPKEKLLAPLSTPVKEVDVDLMKERLVKGSVPLPPARPPQTVFNRVQHYDDASSVFSRSEIGSVVSAVPLSAAALRKRDSEQQHQQNSASPRSIASSNKRPPSAKEMRQALSSVREQNESVSSELARAKRKLEAIEKIVEERESSRRASSSSAVPQSLPKRETQNASVATGNNNSKVALNARREIANDLSISRRAVTPFC